MKKKALSLFLVTAMAVSMVGCGSKDADKNTEKKSTEAAVETEKPAAAEDEAWVIPKGASRLQYIFHFLLCKTRRRQERKNALRTMGYSKVHPFHLGKGAQSR